MWREREVGTRLKKAIARYWRPGSGRASIRNFQAQFSEWVRSADGAGQALLWSPERLQNFQGVTYAAISTYVQGEVLPSIEWIEAAAEFLGVRHEWLAWGIGEPTDEEERRQRASAPSEYSALDTRAWAALLSECPDLSRGVSDFVQVPILRVAHLYFAKELQHRGIRPSGDVEISVEERGDLWVQVCAAIGAALHAPLDALPAGSLWGTGRDDYFMTMTLALKSLAQFADRALLPYRADAAVDMGHEEKNDG